MVFDDQRIQLDHFVVIVQHGNGQFARNVRRKRSDVGEEGLFRHFDNVAPAMARRLYEFVQDCCLSRRVLSVGQDMILELKERDLEGLASCAAVQKMD